MGPITVCQYNYARRKEKSNWKKLTKSTSDKKVIGRVTELVCEAQDQCQSFIIEGFGFLNHQVCLYSKLYITTKDILILINTEMYKYVCI